MDDKLAMRRGFKLSEREKVLVVEDVVTRGGRVRETLDIVKTHGGNTVGVLVLVDRSDGKVDLSYPMTSLLEMSVETFEPDNLPEDLRHISPSKPGS